MKMILSDKDLMRAVKLWMIEKKGIDPSGGNMSFKVGSDGHLETIIELKEGNDKVVVQKDRPVDQDEDLNIMRSEE